MMLSSISAMSFAYPTPRRISSTSHQRTYRSRLNWHVKSYPNEITHKRMPGQSNPYTGIHRRKKVLVCKPHQSTNGSTPKLIQPRRGPYIICSIVLPLVYQIRLPDDTNQVSIHLADIKPYRPRKSSFLRKILPTSALDEIEPVLPHIGRYL